MEVDLQHEKVSVDIQSTIKVAVVDTQQEKVSTVVTQQEKVSTVVTQREKVSTVVTQREKVSVVDSYGRLRKSLINPLTKFFEIFMKKCMNNIRQVKIALSYLVFLSTEADFYAMTTLRNDDFTQ
jgi:histidyl-tRNA synthetase